MITGFQSFVDRYRHSAPERWLDGLIDTRFIMMDWPAESGGPGWSRSDKLALITLLAENGCPILPDAITVIAPLVLHLATGPKKNACLSHLAAHPDAWQFISLEPDHILVPCDTTTQQLCCQIDSTLYLGVTSDLEQQRGYWRITADQLIQLGGTGRAALHLATTASPLFGIHELKTTLNLITQMNLHWHEAAQADLTELQVTLDALEAMYLQDSHLTDRQINLKVTQTRLTSFSLLFQSLGYYALLDPDPVQMANEPLPYATEREHLRQLHKGVERHEMLQQDLIYQQFLQEIS